MATCDVCGKSENMPYHCRHCGGTFCGEHRLPESHDCPGLEDWNDPAGVFDSGFDDSVDNPGTRSSGWLSGLIDTGVGGPLGYFRGNMTFVFLGLMFITFALQYAVRFVLPPTGSFLVTISSYQLYQSIFVISPQHPLYVWTWFTSIFAHGGLVHILFNAIVIYFFGRLVEDYIGSRNFTLLFLGSGVLAGLGHVVVELLRGGALNGALGASGAALAIMGVLTVLNPNLRVYLYFLIPIPIWVLTAGYAFISISGVLGVPILPGVADAAHLVGLVVGLVYGQHIKGRQQVPNRLQFGGGRGGGGMGGPGRGRGPF
jgi:membrane associated rhomboid family serine protease